MTRIRFRMVCVVLGLVLAFVQVAGAADASLVSAAFESIRKDDLRRHTMVLASDTFEGREAGSRGGQAAGAYLVGKLRDLGVQAGGDGDGSNSYFQYFGYDYRNIIVSIPGTDEDLSDEYVVVGAHYDHVGYGNARNSRGPTGYIHNGADDNASGTAGLLEVIEAFAQQNLRTKRSLVFVFWDAEEMGLLGSEYWVESPTVPLRRVRLMINADMIGRLRNNTVSIFGVRTGTGLRQFVSRQNRGTGLLFEYDWTLNRDSDHYPFAERSVPFLMLHTRKHPDYHRPSDDPDKLDYGGLEQVTRLMFNIVYSAGDADRLPNFRREAFYEDESDKRTGNAALRPLPTRLGVSWDEEEDESKGQIRVNFVDAGSPAARAGLQVGDRIEQFGGYRPDQAKDFRTIVLAARNPVSIRVRREGQKEPLELTATLDGDPLRLGITWRTELAEPDCVILTRVVPGSPAALAGLKAGDRIYEADGQSFRTSDEFLERASAAGRQLILTAERRGRVWDARLELLPGQRAMAAK